jgi:hypothetical protein
MTRFAGCALAVLALAACSRAPEMPGGPTATVRLSTENPQGNAAAIAAFFKRTCLDASANQGAFDTALQSAGWEVVRTQSANSGNPINGWQIDHGQVYQSLAEVGGGQRLVDCHIALDAAVSPSVEAMRAALRPLIRDASLSARPGEAGEVGWQWRPRPAQESVLTISMAGAAEGRPGLALHYASTPVLPPAETPAP